MDEQQQSMELLPAKINDRFIAYVIDAFPFSAAYILTHVVVILKMQREVSTQFSARVALACAGAYLLYQFLGNLTGATIGKRLMGLWVVRKDGAPLGAFRSFLRTFGYCLSTPFFNFGFILAILHPESRALHDLLSGSVVIEPRQKNAAEASILFLAAVLTLVAMSGGMVYIQFSRPTPEDIVAVQKAREGLLLMGRMQETYKQANGTYTRKLGDLAKTSGDPQKFKEAFGDIFLSNLFQIEAGNQGYRITASAQDRKRTKLVLEGPPPTLREK